jgi:ubiquinone/menaquinone biosynthesis C-methylase UbiE
MDDIALRTAAIYEVHHGRHAPDRNNPLNPAVVFQSAANQVALYRALAFIGFRTGETVLDVGGGAGGSLAPFMALGCPANTLTSVDVRDNSAEAARRFPGLSFIHADASDLSRFPDRSFDVVYSSTAFYQMPREIQPKVAAEMRRLARRAVIVADWTFALPRQADKLGVTRKRVRELFGLRVAATFRGAMLPPLGRALSRFLPRLFFLANWLPGGLMVYVMPKDAT